MHVPRVASALLLEESGLRCARDGVIRTKGPSGDRLFKWMNASVECQSAAEALMHVPRQDKLPLSILVLPQSPNHRQPTLHFFAVTVRAPQQMKYRRHVGSLAGLYRAPIRAFLPGNGDFNLAN